MNKNNNYTDLPAILYLVGNKVFKSKRSIIGLPEFGNLSKSGVNARFNSPSFSDWRCVKLEEFQQMMETNGNQYFKFMWQRSNGHPEKE